jgi:hypothetical protein
VILLVILVLAVITVPLFKGRIAGLIDIDLGWTWLVASAIGLQILIISVIPHRFEGIHRPLHFLSYALAGAFVVANLKIPGVWLIGLGGLSNLIPIAANGGVMPATATALRAAGMATESGEFVNSGVLEDPKLLFLGDIFSIPGEVPVLNTVFSIGDVFIAIGTVILIHGVTGSKLVWWRRSEGVPGSEGSESTVT